MDNLSRPSSNTTLVANQGIQSPNLSQTKRTDGENQRDFRTTATGVQQIAQEKLPSLPSPPLQSTVSQTFDHSKLVDEFNQKGSDRLQSANPSQTTHLESLNNEESLQPESRQFGSNPPSSVQIEARAKELDGLPQEIGTSTPSSFSPQFTISAEDLLKAAEEDAKIVKLRDIQEAEQKLEKLVITFVNTPITSAGNKAIVDAGKKIFESIENIFDSNNEEHLAQLDKFKASLNKMLKKFESMSPKSSQHPLAKDLVNKFIALSKHQVEAQDKLEQQITEQTDPTLPRNIVNQKQIETWEKLKLNILHSNISDRKSAIDELTKRSQGGTVFLARATKETDCSFVISHRTPDGVDKHTKINIDINGEFAKADSKKSYKTIDEFLNSNQSQFTPPLTLIYNNGSLQKISNEQSELKERESKEHHISKSQSIELSSEHNDKETYDYELVLNLGGGDTANNLTLKAQSEGRNIHTIDLRNKNLEILEKTLNENDTKLLGELTHNSRITIIGHGSPGSDSVSSDGGTVFKASDYAKFLSTYCPKLRQSPIELASGHTVNVKINVIACYSGKDAEAPKVGSSAANLELQKCSAFSDQILLELLPYDIEARSFGREDAVRRNALGELMNGSTVGLYASVLDKSGKRLPPGQLRKERIARPDAARKTPIQDLSDKIQNETEKAPQSLIDQHLEMLNKIENLKELEEELKALINANPNYNFSLEPLPQASHLAVTNPQLQATYEKLIAEIAKLKKELSPEE